MLPVLFVFRIAFCDGLFAYWLLVGLIPAFWPAKTLSAAGFASRVPIQLIPGIEESGATQIPETVMA